MKIYSIQITPFIINEKNIFSDQNMCEVNLNWMNEEKMNKMVVGPNGSIGYRAGIRGGRSVFNP